MYTEDLLREAKKKLENWLTQLVNGTR